jgi:osmotically-inducible protein OsmY
MRDRDLHDAILNRARAQPWADVAMLNLVVHGGNVELRGIVESEEQRNALRILAEGVPGVQVVRNHLEVVPYWSSAV